MKSIYTHCILFGLASLCGCGSDGGTLGDPTGPVTDRAAMANGNFLNVDTFPDSLIIPVLDRDGIDALTDQNMVPPNDPNARYLLPTDLVLGVAINGDVRAYPHNIGWWHEIMNDVVGGVPIVVSFCPLTGTGMVFDGRGDDGRRITLGVSGLLFNNNLVMFDRRDGETLYPQMTFRGITGEYKREDLKLLPVVETTWGYWRKLHPDTKVLSGLTDSYSSGTYTLYPYGQGAGRSIDYRVVDDDIFFEVTPPLSENPVAALFPHKSTTLGVRFGEIAKTYPFPSLGERAIINDTVDGNPIVVLYYAAEKLAIPYSRIVSGMELTFDIVASEDDVSPFWIKDRETGTTWNIKGEGIKGGYRGSNLIQVPSHNAFWFAWATFWQNTGIF